MEKVGWIELEFGLRLLAFEIGLLLSFVAWSFWSLYVGFELCFVKIDC